MSSASWVQDRERLERELRNESYQSLLQNLRGQHPFYRQFNSWDDVIAFMRAGSAKDPRTDDILRSIFGTYGDERDPRWRTVLLALFWRELERIHGFKSHWDSDPETLRTNTTWAFLETIDHIDLRTRPERLGQKVFNDTIHRLYDAYSREWDWENSIVDPGDGENKGEDDDEAEAQNRLETLMGGKRAIEFDEMDLRLDQGVEITRLEGYVTRGLISEPDLFLIVGTRIYGASLSEFASDQGLNYEWAKKRRQRAEAKIKRLKRTWKNF